MRTGSSPSLRPIGGESFPWEDSSATAVDRLDALAVRDRIESRSAALERQASS